MDSPIIVDPASKFGREIDLDRSFPGFPFDDDPELFERPRNDGIRAHLDDLAARHPELAEHLRGPPWPFGGSLLRDRRRRRRDSGGSSNDGQQQRQQQQGQHQVDEDARSQASGSSAASGASAVSSRSGGEPDVTSSSAIPQYGLRNTVDIGQQQRRRDMDTGTEKGERGQRSMSAPPENRQQQQQGHGYQQPQPGQQGQRFVSRVDITPQHNQQQQRSQSPNKPTSNVRHIPIFVEGRDEPVIPKRTTDDSPPPAFQQQQHHQRQSSPPHFHRPSHFNEHFSRQQWPPSHFQNTFYEPAGFEQPMRRQQQFQPQYQQPQYHHQQHQQPSYQQPPSHQQQQQQPPYQQQQTQQPQYQQQQQQEQEIPKPKPPMPKDPLEKVDQVQKEVDDLAEQVRRYTGGTRQDKEYIYLDEMLTRELIKLDDIETEGRENVRQARRNAIKSIQDTISLLETKAPLAGQQSVAREEECTEKNQLVETSRISEPMEMDTKQEKHEPIPLPPAPSSPTKMKVESSGNENASTAIEFTNQNVAPAVQQDTERTDADVENQKTEQKVENRAAESMEQAVVPTSTSEATKHAEEMAEESKSCDGKNGDATQTTMENNDAMSKQQAGEGGKEKEGKMEVHGGQKSSTESPRLQKKAKKTKKKEQQQPVSEQAIPLPPPPPTEKGGEV